MFDATQTFLEAQGFKALNPMRNGLDPVEASWQEHMTVDIAMLFNADGVFMLSGWEDSPGARIEHYIAKEIGLPVYYCGL